MRRLIATAVCTFAVSAAGASLIALDLSDTEPGNNRTQAACAEELRSDNAVEHVGDEDVITAVNLTGDMVTCVGQTLLVEVDIGNPESHVDHAYAVWKFDEPVSEVNLPFGDAGVFFDSPPSSSGGTLVPNGDLVAALPATQFGLMTISIAKTWG